MTSLERLVDAGEHTLLTSSLTVGEILVYPIKHNRRELKAEYLQAFGSITVIPFDTEASAIFAELRAKNPGLRPPDAIQLSCAAVAESDLFLTNDGRLSKVSVSGIGRVCSLEEGLRFLVSQS
jgi:predicted nucleic acid-binding protein